VNFKNAIIEDFRARINPQSAASQQCWKFAAINPLTDDSPNAVAVIGGEIVLSEYQYIHDQ